MPTTSATPLVHDALRPVPCGTPQGVFSGPGSVLRGASPVSLESYTFSRRFSSAALVSTRALGRW